uniref:Fucolectin tachylectin-4 pentraxin-1 domain-containing protein n=1 Tax=Magallana gigas TaxID=29159 RepID=A0A8W8P3B8_MAGGI
MASLCVFLGLVTLSHAYENVALNKPAYQLHPYNTEEQYDASNGVDGLKTNFSNFGGQCVLSANNKYTATWWVNLTSIYNIYNITIFYRTDNVPWQPTNGYRARFLGFSLYVSNTTDRLDGKLCFKDTNFNLTTIPPIFNTTCLLRGQYVIYYNERKGVGENPIGYDPYAFNELCEVEVFG